MKNTHTLVFTRIVGLLEVEYVAVLTLQTTKKMESSAAKELFVSALSKWGRESETGQAAWKENNEDFNIGDFAHHDTDLALKGILEAEGITSARVDIFSGDDSSSYDERLMTNMEDLG